MKRYAVLAVVLITFLIAGCSSLTAQEQSTPAPKPQPKLTNWYKVEIILNEFQDGKKTNTRSYTMAAADDGPKAEMKLGDRVPILTGGPGSTQFQYIDVGLDIVSAVREQQGRISLWVLVDQSSMVAPTESSRIAPNQSIIRQLRMENIAFVTLGKSMLIASVDDPERANHKYTVDATVTKLNP